MFLFTLIFLADNNYKILAQLYLILISVLNNNKMLSINYLKFKVNKEINGATRLAD